MSSNCVIYRRNCIFEKRELFNDVVDYLSARDIYILFSVCKDIQNYINIQNNGGCNNPFHSITDTKRHFVYQVYYKLYESVSAIDAPILAITTVESIHSNKPLLYINNKNTQFSKQAIIVREKLIELIEKRSDYDNKDSCITSLYWLLYMYNYDSLLERLLMDEIIVSPYECTNSHGDKRTSLHYYGNEQTLRLAIRSNQSELVQKILYDMDKISYKKNMPFFWFIWGSNINILYECMYSRNMKIFNIIINFIYSITENIDKVDLLMNRTDGEIIYSDDNEYSEERDFFSQTPLATIPYFAPRAANNLLLCAIIKEKITYRLTPFDITDNDFSYPSSLLGTYTTPSTPFLISDSLLIYINREYNKALQFYDDNVENFNCLNACNEIIKTHNINIFELLSYTNNTNNKYYVLLEILEPNDYYYIHNNLFLRVLYLIRTNKDNFNINYEYESQYISGHVSDNTTFTIIDFIKYKLYHTRKCMLRNPNTRDHYCSYLINLLLIHKELTK
jgi:hypothetical protein